MKGPVNSFIDQIIRKTLKPEKSSPSPHVYNPENAFESSSKARRVGNLHKKKEERTTFMMVQETHANDVPGAIYPETNMVSHFWSNISWVVDFIQGDQ